MTTLVDHGRALIAYTIWANDRILAAAEGIDDGQYAQISEALGHTLGTYRWWHANWTGGAWADLELPTLSDARAGFTASHDALRAYADAMTLDEWNRAEQWWLRWGFDGRLAVGETITQIFYHGIQHRSEIAVLLSSWDHSPGDMDYLTFLRESQGPGFP